MSAAAEAEVISVPDIPATPAGLLQAGRQVWDAIVATWELDVRELLILELAARQADDVSRLERTLKRDGLTVLGSQGQRRMNPVVTELRGARLAVDRLLGELDLPSDDAAGPSTSGSQKARMAAAVRWSRVREQRDMVDSYIAEEGG